MAADNQPANLAIKLWDLIKGMATKNAEQYLNEPIPKDRTDGEYTPEPLAPFRSYFRVWLCEMFLTKSRNWFIDWYPAVHASVQLKFGNYDAVKFSTVAESSKDAQGNGVLLNYPLTELLPFNGGTVELQAALLGLKGTNQLMATIKVLQDFSSLVTAPLGEVLNLAEKISSGMEQILGATDGTVHLPLHQTFISAGGGGQHILQPGYFAVILATAAQVAKDRLFVGGDRLYYADQPGAQSAPIRGHDYMLLRIEGRAERDDWRLKNIQEPLDKAMAALLQGRKEEAEGFKQAALVAAGLSPDLAVYDRRRVVQAIKDELAQLEGSGLTAQTGQARDLNAIMSRRAKPMDWAVSRGPLTVAEIFAE
jgi:hypothetical protein